MSVEHPGQTLQYYRSQHEARPRDAIHLSASLAKFERAAPQGHPGSNGEGGSSEKNGAPKHFCESQSLSPSLSLSLAGAANPAEAVVLFFSLFARFAPAAERRRRLVPVGAGLGRSGGVTVEWLKDQSRPFTFAVSKSPGSLRGELRTDAKWQVNKDH